jgi:hypothetical protein
VADERAERELKEAFKKVSGEDMEIDAYELQGILNAAFQKGTPCSLLLIDYKTVVVFYKVSLCYCVRLTSIAISHISM